MVNQWKGSLSFHQHSKVIELDTGVRDVSLWIQNQAHRPDHTPLPPPEPTSMVQEECRRGETVLESQPGDSVTHKGDTAGGGGSGTEDQTGLSTPGEGLLRDTFKPPGGVRPYHRMAGRVSGLPRLSESHQHALIVTSRHSLKNEVHRHS